MAVSGGRLAKRKTLLNAFGVATICATIAALVLVFIPRNDPAVISLRQSMVELTAPFISFLSLPGEGVSRMYQSAQSYNALVAENNLLRSENRRLQGVESELQRASLLLARYRDVLSMDVGDQLGFIGTRIMADMRSPFARTVLADVGVQKGARIGLAVVGEKGFIGRIVAASVHTSRILLVTDLNSHIPVVIGANRVRAVMSGTNSDLPKIEFLPKVDNVEVNDIVLTSGDGGEIPAGFKIGSIVETETGKAVQLAQNMNHLTLARIIWTKPPEPPEETMSTPEATAN